MKTSSVVGKIVIPDEFFYFFNFHRNYMDREKFSRVLPQRACGEQSFCEFIDFQDRLSSHLPLSKRALRPRGRILRPRRDRSDLKAGR